MTKTSSPTKPVKPTPPAMNKKFYVVLVLITAVLAIVLYPFPQAANYITPIVVGGIAIIAVFRMSRSAREAWLRIALILPSLAGIMASWITGQFLFALLGLAIPIAIVLGLVLRSRMQTPAYLQPVLKELRTGTLDQALQLVNQSIRDHPECWQAYQLRSVIHYSRMQILEAERDARTALKLKPDAFYNYNALSQALLIQGRYTEAKEVCAEALRLAPKQAINHYNLGLACYRLGEYATAAEALTKGIQSELPSSRKLWGYYLVGRSLESLGQQDRAEQTYRTMERYRDGLESLVGSLRDKPDYPDIALARADIADIERRLA